MENKKIVGKLNNLRMPPRKVSLVVDMVRGKSVNTAKMDLKFSNKRAAKPLLKLINSVESDAEGKNIKLPLIIKQIFVGKSATLKRFRAGSRGSPRRILKRTSNITLILEEDKRKL